jgi:phosphatidylserine synthase
MFGRFVHWVGYDLGISPNQVTWGRLVFFVPGWLMWIYKDELAARTGLPWQFFGYFAMVVVTMVIVFDIVDGALARATGQVSDQGKVIDPLVDKLITYSTLALFWSSIDKVGVTLLFVLDMASTFLRGVQVEGANQFGKKKALSQNISKFFFAMAILAAAPWCAAVGNFLIWLAVILATISVGIRVLPEKVKKKVLVLIPQILTMGNLAAGLGTIWCAFDSRLGLGVILNFSAMAFDLIDGAAARKLGVTSSFGKYFDTTADFISFGAAPAFLVAALNGFSGLSVGLGALYVIATCVRLYDYGRSKEKTPAGFFRGMPSPAGAWLVVASVLFGQPGICLAALVSASFLMCLFSINWVHFSRALPNLRPAELTAAVIIAAGLASVNPYGGIAAGPILVYVFTPFWRKPNI